VEGAGEAAAPHRVSPGANLRVSSFAGEWTRIARALDSPSFAADQAAKYQMAKNRRA
jgi:hypothetical protein